MNQGFEILASPAKKNLQEKYAGTVLSSFYLRFRCSRVTCLMGQYIEGYL